MTSKETESKDSDPVPAKSAAGARRQFAVGLLRAFGGALLFACPMLMTMEMWSLGFSIDPLRLALFLLLDVPLLIGLSYYAGFEVTSHRLSDVLDAFTGYAVGFVAAALLLLVFGIIGPGMSTPEIVGKIAVQSVPASIGALLARGQFSERKRQEEERRARRYGGGLFHMAVGALYLSASLASTEEMMLISYRIGPWLVLALMAFTLVVMHGYVRAVVAEGKAAISSQCIPFGTVFLKYSAAGYGIALMISAFTLWTFGRTVGLSADQFIQATIVLGFPASVGAGAARLIL